MAMKKEKPYTIILADDHVMVRRALKGLIQKISNVEVVGEASDGFELLELVAQKKPDLVIVDIAMPKLRGLEATREIKKKTPEVKVIILTIHNEKEYLDYALSAGAEGYLLKEDSDDELFAAIETVRRGGTYISRLLASQMADILVEQRRAKEGQAKVSAEPLSNRERQIVKLIAEGKSSKEIAALLSISARTAQHYRASAMKKLNIKKTADLVKYAIQKGYTSADIGRDT
jgi:DNA-binding NarL/FixJ family response regulator